MNKEKSILMDYIDACELIKETEEDIRKLSKHEVVHDKVSGSNPEFPYQPQSFPHGILLIGFGISIYPLLMIL